MNRAEHLQWAKDRALAELDTDPHGHGPTAALASIIADVGAHPDTAGHHMVAIVGTLRAGGHLYTANEVREHIEGIR